MKSFSSHIQRWMWYCTWCGAELGERESPQFHSDTSTCAACAVPYPQVSTIGFGATCPACAQPIEGKYCSPACPQNGRH